MASKPTSAAFFLSYTVHFTHFHDINVHTVYTLACISHSPSFTIVTPNPSALALYERMQKVPGDQLPGLTSTNCALSHPPHPENSRVVNISSNAEHMNERGQLKTNPLFALEHLLKRTLQRNVSKGGRHTWLRKQSMGGRGGTGFS
jgi:hypothetical protein